jgi:hypothetical protein
MVLATLTRVLKDGAVNNSVTWSPSLARVDHSWRSPGCGWSVAIALITSEPVVRSLNHTITPITHTHTHNHLHPRSLLVVITDCMDVHVVT